MEFYLPRHKNKLPKNSNCSKIKNLLTVAFRINSRSKDHTRKVDEFEQKLF